MKNNIEIKKDDTYPIDPPKSVVGWFDAFLGLFVVLILFFYGTQIAADQVSNPLLVIFLVASLGLVIGAVEIYRAPWRNMRASRDSWTNISIRALIKLLGFFLALSIIAFLYWLFPEYRREYYAQYFLGLIIVAPWIPLIAIPYFFYVEWRLPYERGGAFEAGMLFLGKWKNVEWNSLTQYALGWLVKGYFLPIMFGDVANNIGYLRAVEWNVFAMPFVEAFDLLFLALINLELIFVSAGYVFSLRLFDSHIRKVEDTLFGWFIALISYGPFLGLVYGRYFAYNADGTNWLDWLSPHPMVMVVYGSIILLLLVLHLWCDACFGVRFSNLTNRGIITNGPYRFSKHPAYVIKSLRWWMVSVPFIALNWHEAVRLSLLLVCVNLVYTLRAYTEERMLSSDPTYVAYARWMDRHAPLRFLGYYIPIFSYEWRLARWRERGEITTP